MTMAQKRAEAIAAVIERHLADWGEQQHRELIDALVQLQTDSAMERVKPLLPLLEIAAGPKVRPCSRCGVRLAFVRTAAGRGAPISLETGLNHFIDCKFAEEFRKDKT